MREIHDHKAIPTNEGLKICVTDEPGAGGANHRYEITGFDTASNFSNTPCHEANFQGYTGLEILFQNGPIPDNGVNGVTQEALLAILIDRLRSFQKGPFACRENAIALTKMEEAMHWLHSRTIARMLRGVEGTNQV